MEDNLTINSDSERSFGDLEERETEDSTQDEGSESEAEVEETEETSGETPETEPEESTGEPEYTEKGTKLDPNPKSALHQQLANERKTRLQMEQVLGNPKMLTRFMEQQYGIKIPQPKQEETPAQVDAPQFKKFTADDFENIGDVAEKLNEIQETFSQKTVGYEKKIEELNNTISGLLQNGRNIQVANKMSDDVLILRSEKELDPKSPEFIEGLESDIASLYHRLDFDESTGSYKGQYSIADIGKQIISAARKARAKGSLQAQTVVKKKTEGRVRTSQVVSDDQGDETLAPGDSIAKGVAKMFR